MRRVLALLLASTACTGFVRTPSPGAQDPPSRELLEVWAHDQSYLLDHLRVDGDSMRGRLRTDRGPGAEFAIAQSEVDSVRTTQRDSVDAGLVIGASVLLFYVYILRAARGN